jgi:hypothetical protein
MLAEHTLPTYAVDPAAAYQCVRERYQLEEAKSPVRERPDWRKP